MRRVIVGLQFAFIKVLKFFRWIWNKFRIFIRFITFRRVTRTTVIADARSLNKGAVVLYDYNEMIKFSYELFIREGILKGKELNRFIERGDKILRNRHVKQHGSSRRKKVPNKK